VGLESGNVWGGGGGKGQYSLRRTPKDERVSTGQGGADKMRGGRGDSGMKSKNKDKKEGKNAKVRKKKERHGG